MRRTNDVHKHIKVSVEKPTRQCQAFNCMYSCEMSPFDYHSVQGLLDLMIIEEQDLKQRLLKTIESCQKELSLLCSELQLPPYKVQTNTNVRCLT